MSTVQMQNLLDYLNGLSLSASNKRWLAEHYFAPAVAEDSNCKYVRESLERAVNEVKAAKQSGETFQTVDEFLKEFAV